MWHVYYLQLMSSINRDLADDALALLSLEIG